MAGSNMEEIASPLAHSCAHCVDIVLPGSPEKIHISNIGSPGDPFSDLHFYEEDLNRLDLSLADLGIRANAGCNFSQYLKDNIEHKMYKSADPNAIQLYTRQENDGYMIIEPLICLQSLHLQDEVLASKDLSRCFATAGSRGGLLYIYCVLTKTSGDDLDGKVTVRRSISLDPLSPRTVTDVRDWLECCEHEQNGDHKICSLSESAYVPTRLVKISGPADQLQLKIVYGDDMKEHNRPRYAALSYCWGGDQPNKLTQGNYDLYKRKIPWETLPKTIQDSARTVHALGLHYIWIDSMCIVQDSKEDKEAEISQMTKVYAHATLTIVNKRSDKVTGGFLHPRTLPSGTSSIQYRANNGQLNRLTLSFEDAFDLEEDVAIHTRGWTLQEYLLSRRRLVIGTWSTEWHCRHEDGVHRDGWIPSSRVGPLEGIPFNNVGEGWAGHGPFGSKEAESVYSSSFINAAMFFSVNPGFPSGQLVEELIRRSWYAIVEAYSSRSVTESEDRVLAISGIAGTFANFMPKRYIAGLWENMMPGCLFWSKLRTANDRPVEYRAPSWSWISVDGGVTQNPSNNCICEVLSIEYMPKSVGALYGAVRSATLHIEGPALSVEWRHTRRDRQLQENKQPQKDLSEFRWRREGSDDHQDPQLEVMFDAREQTTEWREVILLAHELSNHGRNARDTWCIALTKVDQVEVDNKPQHRFRRLGAASFWNYSPLPRVESWPVSSYYVI